MELGGKFEKCQQVAVDKLVNFIKLQESLSKSGSCTTFHLHTDLLQLFESTCGKISATPSLLTTCN